MVGMMNISNVLMGFLEILVLIFLCMTNHVYSEKIHPERMKAELDFIRNIFDMRYAPGEWKKQYSGWDLDIEIVKAKNLVDSSDHTDLKTFQRILKAFTCSTQDYHVGVTFLSTESATLPFRVKGVNGRYFISYLDQMRLSPLVYPISIGDELVLFDGRPTHEVVQELKALEGKCLNKPTDWAFAEFYLTNRFGFKGQIVPKKPITIGVRSNHIVRHYQLMWDYRPEQILNPRNFINTPFQAQVKGPKKHTLLEDHPLLFPLMMAPLYEELEATDAIIAERNKDLLGSRESFLPSLGKIWWKSEKENFFHAYLYETDQGKFIGYLRIPHFRGSEAHLDELEKILAFFSERTDALVIDQFNNPGGYAHYMYALASMLTQNALSTPKHRRKITQKDVAYALKELRGLELIQSDAEAQEFFGKTFFGTLVTHQFVQFYINYCRFIIEEWKAGRSYTNPFYICSIDQINPHPTIRYTKPILLLINELDISCGDFFPAIMQDNKRAVTMGTTTAGAGGIVETLSYPNPLGISSLSYTISLAERIDNHPIENRGVTPDIEYNISKKDLQNNYCGYVKAINDILHLMTLH
jgi:hypothetical protein